MEQLSVTSKGQVTIPKAIRQQLGIRAGTQVSFRVVGDHIEIHTVTNPASVKESGFGLLHTKTKPVPADFGVADLIKPE